MGTQSARHRLETAARTGSALRRPSRWPLALAPVGLFVAVAAWLAVLAAGPGYRFGVWGLGVAFALLSWAAIGGLFGAVLSMVGKALSRWHRLRQGSRVAVLGLLVGGTAFVVPLSYWVKAQQVPPIHDITTDTGTPPAFVAILPLRAGAPNPADYGGPTVAAEQRAAYPDIAPAVLALPPGQAFGRALAAARSMGWQVIAADNADGRIEATAETFWFGFKDDVVIRIRSQGAMSRVDVRSVSRVGRSDVGTNATRIRAFLAMLAGD